MEKFIRISKIQVTAFFTEEILQLHCMTFSIPRTVEKGRLLGEAGDSNVLSKLNIKWSKSNLLQEVGSYVHGSCFCIEHEISMDYCFQQWKWFKKCWRDSGWEFYHNSMYVCIFIYFYNSDSNKIKICCLFSRLQGDIGNRVNWKQYGS